MNIVFVSHSSFNENLMVGSLHLARSLAEMGHTVVHAGPPVTPFHRLVPNRQYRERLARADRKPSRREGMIDVEPMALVPWQIARRFLPRWNLFVESSNLVSAIRGVFPPGTVDLLLLDNPRMAGVERSLAPKAFFYRPTDFYGEMKGDPAFVTAERMLLDGCDGIIATSEPVRQHGLTLRPGLPSLLLENGVEFDHFSAPVPEPEELQGIPRPRLVYVGALDGRFDHALVAQLADAFPRAQFVLVGPETASFKFSPRANLHVLGPKPYRRVPGFLQHADIGLLPMVDNLANSGRSPMKFYEYGAAGLPILATRTLELQRRGWDFVHLFSGAEEAMQKLEGLVKDRPDRAQIVKISLAQAWPNKARTLLDFVARHSALKPERPEAVAS